MKRAESAIRLAAPLVAILATAALPGCASVSQKFAETASQMPGIGLPADAPARPEAGAIAYPAVHDIPPPRNSVLLSDFEQKKLENDLVQARDHQQAMLGVKVEKAEKRPPKPETKTKSKSKPKAATVPPASSQTIY
jgi:hypothetical protein